MADAPEQSECWICRDSSSTEPLVHPCNCRGSMGGVHASCVEAWVYCSRVSTGRQRPRCPVCRARYGGQERRPGLGALLHQCFKGLAKQLAFIASEALRFAILGALLVQYTAAAALGTRRRPCEDAHAVSRDAGRTITTAGSWLSAPRKCLSSWQVAALQPGATQLGVRVLAIGALGIFLLYKLAVITTSLPPQRAPPSWRMARRFFTTDTWCVVQNAAELIASVVLLGCHVACGDLPLRYFLPVALAGLVPLIHLMLWYAPSVCMKEVALWCGSFCYAPVLAARALGHLVLRHRRRFLNPLDGCMHVAAALVAVVVCVALQSRRLATAFFAVHSVLLALGLLECAMVRHLHWRDGHAWWCAVLIALEAANVALDRRWFTLVLLLVALRSLQHAVAQPWPPSFLEDSLWWCTLLVVAEGASLGLRECRGAPRCKRTAEVAACIWLGLVIGLACAVNWQRCVRHYQWWQRRHATFVLCVPGLPSPGPSEGAATPASAPAPSWPATALPGTHDVTPDIWPEV